MALRDFDELLSLAVGRGVKRLAVARAEDELVLGGLVLAQQKGLIEPVLFGNRKKIEEIIERLELPLDCTIHNCEESDNACALRAVSAVREGEADLLMKGHMTTHDLFSAVLDKQAGLANGGLLSHIALLRIDNYPKLFGTTDGGLIRHPKLKHKIGIVRNTVKAFHQLGYDCPKIGLLSYVEKVMPDDFETEEWAEVVRMAKAGEFGEAKIEGPMAVDLCLNPQAKIIKDYKSEIAGDVDAIVAPDITPCNAMTKALIFNGGQGSGVVVGARIPIVSLSRVDTPEVRLRSISAAIAMLPGAKA